MRVCVIVAGYSAEQLRRKAHLENGGTLENYDRSHYTHDRIQLGENKNDTNNTNNN